MVDSSDQILEDVARTAIRAEITISAPNAGCVSVEPAHTAIGTAAALDEAAAEREQAELRSVAAGFGRMLVLLREARSRLDDSRYQELVGQIDAELHGRDAEVSEDGLVLESYGNGHAWLRAEAAA